MQHNKWKCPKCQNVEFEEGQFAATGGGLSKFWKNRKGRFNNTLQRHKTREAQRMITVQPIDQTTFRVTVEGRTTTTHIRVCQPTSNCVPPIHYTCGHLGG